MENKSEINRQGALYLYVQKETFFIQHHKIPISRTIIKSRLSNIKKKNF